MSRARIPVIPTIIVVAAVLVMIGLGIWQFQRRAEKAQALQLAASNPARPPVAFPQLPPVSPEILFRPSSVQCLRVVGWQVEAGRAADGSTGYRHIAQCVGVTTIEVAADSVRGATRPLGDAPSPSTNGHAIPWSSSAF